MSEKNWPKPTKLFFNWDAYAWQSYKGDLYTPDSYEKKDLEVYTAAQVREIVAAEREACAQVLDAMADEAEADMEPNGMIDYFRAKAAEIRARGTS